MGLHIGKIFKNVVKDISETLGLAPDLSGQEAAAKAMAAAQEAAKNLQQNLAVDLSNPQTTQVSTGADAAQYGGDEARKVRRRYNSTVSSNLGING